MQKRRLHTIRTSYRLWRAEQRKLRPRTRTNLRNRIFRIAVLTTIVLLAVLIWIGYQVESVGFSDKRLWDWMGLLIIPAVLGLGGWWFNRQERKADRDNAAERQRQAILTTYFDSMANLLIEKNLRGSAKLSEVRSVARAQTLSALRNLDAERKRQVLLFLYESALIGNNPVVDLVGADLRGANLEGADLHKVHLKGVYLEGANLRWAKLNGAHLERSHLDGANLLETVLLDAHLNNAYLEGTDLDKADLVRAKMKGAHLSNACLIFANLGWAHLEKADLRKADLRYADLHGANLIHAQLDLANLEGAKLEGAQIEEADLYRANLTVAHISPWQIRKASRVNEATMPDGSKYEDWLKDPWEWTDDDLDLFIR